ncbi:hypothetical protein Purlil1_11682 [Purpureocillium lilacinum]|uniref:Uncharacterized protein n=1 Tax=Purpureocillium lilacinum TaxID=33203 RepID=A0ABR0BJ77_PURLI|nr:hypothetical protein Purlil1_11682 [Purpureocillium lilacinum]
MLLEFAGGRQATSQAREHVYIAKSEFLSRFIIIGKDTMCIYNSDMCPHLLWRKCDQDYPDEKLVKCEDNHGSICTKHNTMSKGGFNAIISWHMEQTTLVTCDTCKSKGYCTNIEGQSFPGHPAAGILKTLHENSGMITTTKMDKERTT